MNGPRPHEISGHEMKFMPVSIVVYFSLATVSCVSIGLVYMK